MRETGYNQAAWRKRSRPLFMSDITQTLSEIEYGDPAAAERLLPLVYDELRNLATAKLANVNPSRSNN